MTDEEYLVKILPMKENIVNSQIDSLVARGWKVVNASVGGEAGVMKVAVLLKRKAKQTYEEIKKKSI